MFVDSSDGGSAGRQLTVTSSRRDDGTVRIRLSGELDTFVVSVVRERVTTLLAAPTDCVELDLGEVTFCDAAGARELLWLRNWAVRRNIRVVPLATSAAVRYVLRLLEVDDWD